MRPKNVATSVALRNAITARLLPLCAAHNALRIWAADSRSQPIVPFAYSAADRQNTQN
jgi:hypothetical protein